MRNLFVILFLLMSCYSAWAQKEANFWYFGARAGVNFNSGSPVTLTNSAMTSEEGCATVSDANGNLLFYTNGATVWNRNHVVMTNGSNLTGDPKATQSALIVPKPGSSTLYYIFTIDYQGGKALVASGDLDGVSNGFRYTLVDMSASGGLGAVVLAEKNVPLVDTTTEGLTGVLAANNTDYWVVVHGTNNNRYLSFRVTAAGINPVPVVSNSGPVVFVSSITTGLGAYGAGAVGTMKIAPNRLKIAACHSGENALVAISDFDPATGVVYNTLDYTLKTDTNSGGPSGCEFSHCAEYLYVNEFFYKRDSGYYPMQTKIWRYDLNAGNAISAFATIPNEYNTAMQLAPDGKIYLSSKIKLLTFPNTYGDGPGPNLHAINNPRLPGATFTLNAVSLLPRRSEYGLPNFMPSLFTMIDFQGVNSTTNDTSRFCAGDTVLFNGRTGAYDSIRWNFGDPASGINNTSTQLSPRHQYTSPGTYTIKFYRYLCNIKDSAVQSLTINGFPVIKDLRDTTICVGASVLLDGTAVPVTTYAWSTGATTPTINVNTAGKYVLTANNRGCISKDSMNLTLATPIAVSVTATATKTAICAGEIDTFRAIPVAGLSGQTYQWYKNNVLQPGETDSIYRTSVLNNNDQIKVVMTGGGPCTTGSPATSNIIVITVRPNPNVSVTQPVICQGATASITASGASTYTWSGGLPNGTPVTTPILNSTTSYLVTGTDVNGCRDTATAVVTVNTRPNVSVTSANICAGNTASLTASGALTYSWSGGLPNGATVTTPILSSTTSYLVTGTDANNCTDTATAVVTVRPAPDVTVTQPVGCTGTSVSITASGALTYTWSGGLPNGAIVSTPVLTASTSYLVTGTAANGCTDTATSIVTINPQPAVVVNSPTGCSGDTIRLTASGASTYTWSGGLPNGSSVVTPPLNSNTSYTVIGTDGNGCKDTAIANVTILTRPSVSVGSVAICAGNTASLTASGASTYSWSGGLPNAANVTTPPLSATTAYLVTGTAVNGCTDTATAIVTVNTNPDVTVNSPAICAGTSAVLTASGASTYTWSGGLPNGSSVTTPILNNSTSYQVTGTAANGCTDTATAFVTVGSAAQVSVNSPVICSGTTATLIASGATSYTWSGGLPNGSAVTTPALTTTTSYIVTGTDPSGCTDTATAVVTVLALPVVSVNSPAICPGDSAVLNASGASTYTWSGGLPNGSSVTTPPLFANTVYTVTGTDANNCTNTAQANVTMRSLPNVTVNSPVICAGDSAILTASGALSYTWTGGLPAGANVTTPVLNTSTTYMVTGTDGNGCTDTATAAVTVNPRPVVAVNSPTVCAGQPATLTATGASTYTWSGGLPGSATVTTPPILANTSYTVTGTDARGCKNTATANITVSSAPSISVNSPSICIGQPAVLTATGADTYTWSNGATGPSITVSPASTTTYDVTGLLTGCATPSTATATVKVNSLPVIVVNSPSICQGSSATLTASGASTYSWSGGLPAGATVSTPALSLSASYTVTGVDTNGCSNNAVANVTVVPPKTTTLNQTICEGQSVTVGTQTFNTSGSYTINLKNGLGCDSTVLLNLTVNPPLAVQVSVTADKNTICAGESVTFTATPVNGGASPVYQWYLNALPVGSNSPTYRNDTLVDNDEVWVSLQSSEPCTQTAVALSEKVRIAVSRIDYIKPQIVFCAGQTALLDLNIPQSGYTIQWVNGTETQTTTDLDQISLTNTVSGFVRFTIRYGSSCQLSDTVNYTVHPAPRIQTSVDRDKVKFEEEVQFSVTGSGPYTYSWTPAVQLSNSTIPDPTAIISEPTWFSVTATDARGCSVTDSLFVDMIDECSPDYVFVPNAFSPNYDGLNDCFGPLYVPAHTEYHLVIFNRWGETVFDSQRVDDCWDGNYKGEMALIDSYSFALSFRCYNGVFIMKKGVVTLIR